MKKNHNLNLNDLSESLKKYLYTLQKNNQFEFFPMNYPDLEYGSKLKLGFSCFAIKSFYIMGETENFTNSKLTNWAKYINSYQVDKYPYVKGSFVDQSLVDYYNNEKKLLTSIKDVGKKGINRFTSKNYETNNLKLTKAINAETKQAISTLYQIGFKNEIILDNPYSSNIDILNYLHYSLNWKYPWNAGAQFASLCVYSATQNYGYELILSNFIKKLVDKDTGSYFSSYPTHPREIINGAMKVISGLDWIDHEIHYPKQLIDFCLSNKPIFEGCDIVDFVYVLHKCSNTTDYRNEEIKEYFREILELIQTLYVENQGAFSYFRNSSQTYYYGVNISSGSNIADIHGTTLIIWALAMIFETCEIEDFQWKILKP